MKQVLKRHSGFCVIAGVLGVGIMGLLGLGGYYGVESAKKAKIIAELTETKTVLMRQPVSPTRENILKYNKQCEEFEARASKLSVGVSKFEKELEGYPRNLIDYTFEYQSGIEGIKEAAKKRQVAVDASESFGLDPTGTRKEEIELLNKKLYAVKEVAGALIKCQPMEISSIDFETKQDNFAMVINFKAHTQVLRKFLKESSKLKMPLELAQVEVGEVRGQIASDKLLIESRPSDFKLTLNYLQKRGGVEEMVKEKQDGEELKEWQAPRSKSDNVFMVYDLFTPPSLYQDEKSGAIIAKEHPLVTRSINYMAAAVVADEPMPCRIQLQGWSKSATGDEITAMLSCENSNVAIIAKEGDTFPEEGFSVICCREKIEESRRLPRVEIMDHLSGEQLCLSEKTTYLKSVDKIICKEKGTEMIVGFYDKERRLFLQEDKTFTVISYDEEDKVLHLRMDSQTEDFSRLHQIYLSNLTLIK